MGMYRLWWQRERNLYWGKGVDAQRAEVFTRAGIPASILKAFKEIDASWPKNARYQASGDSNTLSYIKYLLVPRTPSDKSEYQIEATGSTLVINGKQFKHPPTHTYDERPKAYGFILSLFLVTGVVLFIRALLPSLQLGIPELTGISCFLLFTVVVLSTGFLNSSKFGFIVYTIVSLLGWVQFFYTQFKATIDSNNKDNKKGTPQIQIDPYLVLFCAIGSFLFLWVMLMSVIVVPDDWDAWAIWGVKAKMLALGRGPLINVSYFGHADYPLLWPSVWAFSGWCSGGWEEHWSRGWGAIFFILCCWEIAVIIKRETNQWDIGILGGTLFASVPLVPLVASWSYAEAPFWLMTVSCFGCLQLWRKSRKDRNLLCAAFLAAAAAYTKNEGVLFFVLAAGWLLIDAKNQRIRSLILFSVAFVILYAPWYYWVRVTSGLDSHATAGLHLSTETVSRALDRFPRALGMIVNLYGDIKQWNLVLWGIGAGWMIAIWKTKPLADLLLPMALLLGYLIIVVFHSADIYWQVGTSWNRLTLQVMPLALVVLVPRIWNLYSQTIH